MMGLYWRAGRVWPMARRFAGLALTLSAVFWLYIWRLGSLTPGLGPQEYAARQMGASGTQILNNGINAPYYLIQHLLVRLLPGQTAGLRLASVLFGLMLIACLYGLLRSLFGRTTGLFSILIFIATPWIVLSARTAGPDIMLLWPIALFSVFVWFAKSQSRLRLPWLAFCVIAALGLYIPGMVVVYLLAAAAASQYLLTSLRRLSRSSLIIGGVMVLLLSIPLIRAIAIEPSHLRELMLLPAKWPHWLEALRSIGWSALAIFWHNRISADPGIGRLPILNIFQDVLCVFGAYALGSRLRRTSYFAAALLIISIIAAGLNYNLSLINLGFVVLAIFMAAGLRYLYIEWRRVFPHNPFASALSLGLIILVVGAHILYGIRYSVVAWPQAPSTKNTYVIK